MMIEAEPYLITRSSNSPSCIRALKTSMPAHAGREEIAFNRDVRVETAEERAGIDAFHLRHDTYIQIMYPVTTVVWRLHQRCVASHRPPILADYPLYSESDMPVSGRTPIWIVF